MKYVILAAGEGKRLKELTKNIPKCLVEYKGKPLVSYILDNVGMDDEVIMVVGYLKDAVKAAVNERYKNLNIRFVENPEYDKTNTSHSLWLAREFLSDGFVYVNGDLIPDKRIFDDLKNGENVVFYDQNRLFKNNMQKFSAEAARALFELRHNRNEKAYDLVFKIMGRFEFKVIDISGYDWREIDTQEDLE